MNAIDLRLSDTMQVMKLIPRPSQSIEAEFDYPNFPYIHYDIFFDEFMGKRVHWHWHDTIHYIQVLSGSIVLRTAAGVTRLAPGDICFVNVNTLHSLEPFEDSPANCRIRSYVFQPSLITGAWENDISTRYLEPVLNNADLQAIRFDEKTAALVKEQLDQAVIACREKNFGYEFRVRHHLTEAWLIFLQFIPGQLQAFHKIDDRLRTRTRTMLQFIRNNYTRKIDLDEIAESALISQRECFRCFKQTLGITPNHYLQNFRVRMAARALLETDDPVADISMQCGFSSTSYFGKTFQKYMNCSPTEYRQRHMEPAEREEA